MISPVGLAIGMAASVVLGWMMHAIWIVRARGRQEKRNRVTFQRIRVELEGALETLRTPRTYPSFRDGGTYTSPDGKALYRNGRAVPHSGPAGAVGEKTGE